MWSYFTSTTDRSDSLVSRAKPIPLTNDTYVYDPFPASSMLLPPPGRVGPRRLRKPSSFHSLTSAPFLFFAMPIAVPTSIMASITLQSSLPFVCPHKGSELLEKKGCMCSSFSSTTLFPMVDFCPEAGRAAARKR